MAGWQDDPVVGGAPSGGGWQNDPIVGGKATAQTPQHGALYNTLFKEGGGGTALASADEGVFPALRDYALAGADDLTLGALKAHLPTSIGNAIAQAHSNLGPMDYVQSAAAYGLGPGKVLAPLGKAIGGAGIGGMAAEGALAGGTSAAVGSQDPSLTGVAGGALTGAALGGAAGALGKGVAKMGATPGSIDPDVALAATKKINDDAWDAGTKIPVNGVATNNAISSALKGLDPSQQTGLSDTFLGKISQIQGAISDQGKLGQALTANDVNSWKRQINEAAGPGIEGGIANQIGGNLDNVLEAHGAGQWQKDANEAYQNYMMAQNLGEWGRKAAVGAPLGQAPLTEAEKFYQGKPQYQPLVDLYQKSQSQNDPSWALGHMAAGLAGDVGGWMFGFPGHFLGELAGYAGLKPMIKGAYKGAKQNALGKSIQQLYPQTTGQQLTGAQPGPQVGEAIKNAMLGGAY